MRYTANMKPNQADQILAVLSRHPEVRVAILFGSLADGRAGRDSDLDLAVEAECPLNADEKTALIAELAEMTGRPVDLVDLRGVGEPLLGEILKNGRRLVGSDERFAKLVSRHLVEEADFLPYYRRILAERRRAWIG
ncbi:MAG: nucleotidyltransferase domain-containing protein [Betaproteobacteria bacterium]|nr:nucleotidyltransferase domain-containing protein [Betaproteobacteria bacterium]